jgi:heat shock protein HslJ
MRTPPSLRRSATDATAQTRFPWTGARLDDGRRGKERAQAAGLVTGARAAARPTSNTWESSMRVLRRTPVVLLAVALSTVLITSCGSSSGGGSDSPTAATSGPAAADLKVPTTEQMTKSWAVFALPSKPGASEQKVDFTASQVSTSDGCNALSGPYTLGSDGAFKAGPLAGTQKACATPADTRHVDALQAATKVGIDDRSGWDQLIFTDGNGAIVLVLQDAAGS